MIAHLPRSVHLNLSVILSIYLRKESSHCYPLWVIQTWQSWCKGGNYFRYMWSSNTAIN